MICAEDIDELARAALELVEVVGEICSEIGDLAVARLQDAVLAVAETLRFQKKMFLRYFALARACRFGCGKGALPCNPLCLQAEQQLFDRALGFERAFGDEAVEAHAQLLQV